VESWGANEHEIRQAPGRAKLLSDLINVLKDVTSRLDRAGVRYMISGSMALNYYALPRMTRDIDLVVEMTTQDLERVSREFSGVYYMAEDSMRTAVAQRGVFNLIHLEALIKNDIVVRKEGEFRTTEFSRRREAEIGGAKMFIVASVDSIDWGDVGDWAGKLGLADLIHEVRL